MPYDQIHDLPKMMIGLGGVKLQRTTVEPIMQIARRGALQGVIVLQSIGNFLTYGDSEPNLP